MTYIRLQYIVLIGILIYFFFQNIWGIRFTISDDSQHLLWAQHDLSEQFKNKNISIVFGCGGNRDQIKRPIMGQIANQFCNKIYLTDDNPRNENPKKIRLDIKKK